MPKVTLSDVLRRLEEAESCWLTTVTTTGAPHAIPVWAVWHEGAAWVYSAQSTRHVRHVQADARVTLHLPETHEVVLVEATASIVDTHLMADALGPTLKSRYATDVEAEFARQPTCFVRIAPLVIRTWGSSGRARWNLVGGEWQAVKGYAPY